MEFRRIKIADIEIHEDRIEGGYGDIQGLASNLKKYGQINPVTVIETGIEQIPFKIIAGRRRIKALSSNGETEVDAIIYKSFEIESEESLALAENTAREEMNAVDEGVLFARELASGVSVDEISALFCRSKSAVYQRAKLAKLNPEFRGLFKNKKINLVDAARIADFSENQQKELYKIIEKKIENHCFQSWHLTNALGNISRDFIGKEFTCADCETCNKRTRWSDPSLFPELNYGNEDRCLDHECYFRKLKDSIKKDIFSWYDEHGEEFSEVPSKLIISGDDFVGFSFKNEFLQLTVVSDSDYVTLNDQNPYEQQYPNCCEEIIYRNYAGSISKTLVTTKLLYKEWEESQPEEKPGWKKEKEEEITKLYEPLGEKASEYIETEMGDDYSKHNKYKINDVFDKKIKNMFRQSGAKEYAFLMLFTAKSESDEGLSEAELFSRIEESCKYPEIKMKYLEDILFSSFDRRFSFYAGKDDELLKRAAEKAGIDIKKLHIEALCEVLEISPGEISKNI